MSRAPRVASIGAVMVVLVLSAGLFTTRPPTGPAGGGPLDALAATSAVAATPDPAPKTTLPEIEDEVMCPICGTLLSLSAAPAAQRERVFIRRLIRQGKTKDEIKAALVAEYGGQVLAEPEQRGISLWAYILPTVLLVIAAVAVIGSIVRRRRERGEADGPGSTDGPRDGPDPPSGSPEDDDRLRQDMARFDL